MLSLRSLSKVHRAEEQGQTQLSRHVPLVTICDVLEESFSARMGKRCAVSSLHFSLWPDIRDVVQYFYSDVFRYTPGKVRHGAANNYTGATGKVSSG
jgi:DNA relaxase NicK